MKRGDLGNQGIQTILQIVKDLNRITDNVKSTINSIFKISFSCTKYWSERKETVFSCLSGNYNYH
jgi:hypothetical protein